MNNLSKIFLTIIIVLIIVIVALTYFCFHWRNATYYIGEEMTKLVEKLNTIEKDYNRDMNKVKIEVEEDSITASGLNIIITDNNNIPYIWKEEYTIEQKDNDVWKKLDTLTNIEFSEKVYELDEKNEIEQTLEWKSLYGSLTNGTYRIVKHVSTPNSELYFESNNFEIK